MTEPQQPDRYRDKDHESRADYACHFSIFRSSRLTNQKPMMVSMML
jgi:hypothetical protein